MKKVKFKKQNITIDDSSGEEKLLINDKPIPFKKNAAGYFIYYQKNEATLLDAAKAFVKSHY